MTQVHNDALLNTVRAKVDRQDLSVLCGPNVISFTKGGLEEPMDPGTEAESYKQILDNVSEVRERAAEDQSGRVFVCVGTQGGGQEKTSKMILDKLMSVRCDEELAMKFEAATLVLNAFGVSTGEDDVKNSRFGCLYEVQLDKPLDEDGKPVEEAHVVGVAFTTFGLEAGHITKQRLGERNYEVFYQLCAHCDSSGMEALRLRGADAYNILKGGGLKGNYGDVEHDFVALQGALELLGFTPMECGRIWAILAAVIHLGQLDFGLDDEQNMQAEPAATVRVVAALLRLDGASALSDIFELIGDPNEVKKKGGRHKPTEKVAASRDGLSRVLYERVFSWLIAKINLALCSEEASAIVSVLSVPGGMTAPSKNPGGFSLLCRNYIHERFVHYFNTIMFTNQAMRLKAEGVVPLTDLDAPTNSARLDLLEKQGGIFSVIDEVGGMPSAKNDTLLAKLISACTGHPDFLTVKQQGPLKPQDRVITIRHSFGDATYYTEGFLDEDGDDSFTPALQSLHGTTCALLKQLFPSLLGSSAEAFANAAVVSRAAMVKAQVASVRQVLSGFLQPIFVHCLSLSQYGEVPDNTLDDLWFDHQLEAYSVLPSIMWQRFGYPIPIPSEEFWDRYYMLSPLREFTDFRHGCEDVLARMPFEKHHWQIGHTLVFMRPKVLSYLEEKRESTITRAASAIGSIIKRQRIWRWMRVRKESMMSMQPILRGILTRQLYNRSLEIAFMAFSERGAASMPRPSLMNLSARSTN